MRAEHARDMARLARTITDNLNAAHELQIKQLKDMIASLRASLQGSRSRENLARGKRFGRKSEKGDKLGKRDDSTGPGLLQAVPVPPPLPHRLRVKVTP